MGQTEICRWADQMLRTNSEAVTQNGTLLFPLAVGLTTAAAPLTQQLADGRRAVVCTWGLPITSVLGTSLRNKVIHHNFKQLGDFQGYHTPLSFCGDVSSLFM